MTTPYYFLGRWPSMKKDITIKMTGFEYTAENYYRYALSPAQRLLLWPPCHDLDEIGAKALALGLIRGKTFIHAIKDY